MQNAMMSIEERDEFYYKARGYCHEREIYDPNVLLSVEYSLRHKAFMQEIAPIQKAMVDVYSLAAPSPVILHSDGRIERRDDGLTDDMRDTLAKYQEIITDIAKQYAR